MIRQRARVIEHKDDPCDDLDERDEADVREILGANVERLRDE